MRAIWYPLSLTRLLIDGLGFFFPRKRHAIMTAWIYVWFGYVIGAATLIQESTYSTTQYATWFLAIFIYTSVSRISEIIYAFITDALGRMAGYDTDAAKLPTANRIHRLGISYIEIAFHFGFIAYFMQVVAHNYKLKIYYRELRSVGDAIYFSFMTLTTTGYGDIVPIFWTSKLLAMGETLSGIALFALALGVYLGLKPK